MQVQEWDFWKGTCSCLWQRLSAKEGSWPLCLLPLVLQHLRSQFASSMLLPHYLDGELSTWMPLLPLSQPHYLQMSTRIYESRPRFPFTRRKMPKACSSLVWLSSRSSCILSSGQRSLYYQMSSKAIAKRSICLHSYGAFIPLVNIHLRFWFS